VRPRVGKGKRDEAGDSFGKFCCLIILSLIRIRSPGLCHDITERRVIFCSRTDIRLAM
jgi:hypothetical protein